ncbi:TetR/AcrR family transcriptional regulator C-terminal domain-containing protein [Kitasatospora sp. NPDC001540]|uniref:TetR/AcrR family transcriptional regulator C-terminal domain-containing protein n=1 Tax=Kitasatospora sp. NPDC001540 TaxID=3364014 RepID=UPI00368717D8
MAADTEEPAFYETLIWSEAEPDGDLLDPPLSRADVVAALLRIADGEGLPAVSVARLTSELGPAGRSVPSHVRYLGDLEDLLIDGVLAELVLPEPKPGQWQADLRTAALELRAAIARHPWFPSLTFRRPLFGPRALDWLDHIMTVAEGAGLPIAEAAAYAGIVTGHVLGAAMCEAEEREMQRRRAGDRTNHEVHNVLQEFLGGIVASGRYPAFSRFLQAGAQHLTPDESFEISLDALLAGLALRASGRTTTE